MKRECYFQKMRETSEAVNPFIIESIRTLENDLYELIKNLPPFKKRSEKTEKLRPFLLRLSYELNEGKSWRELIPIAAAVEMLNISTYFDNAVLDSKGNVTNESDYIIAGRLLRNIATKIVRENYANENLEKLIEDIDFTIYTGQYSDLHNFYYDKVKNMAPEEFYKIYIGRCQKLTGKFLSNVAFMGSILSGSSNEDIGLFGTNLGISVQIINDIGDFVPPERKRGIDIEKIYQDQYSDIKNGKITLPVFYALNKQEFEKSYLVEVITGIRRSNVDLQRVTDILLSSGAIEYSKKVASYFGKTAKKILNKFKKSEARDYLSLMTQIYRTNKYICTLKKYQNKK
jgi:geranylgeranyl pyrophosphate synthase